MKDFVDQVGGLHLMEIFAPPVLSLASLSFHEDESQSLASLPLAFLFLLPCDVSALPLISGCDPLTIKDEVAFLQDPSTLIPIFLIQACFFLPLLAIVFQYLVHLITLRQLSSSFSFSSSFSPKLLECRHLRGLLL